MAVAIGVGHGVTDAGVAAVPDPIVVDVGAVVAGGCRHATAVPGRGDEHSAPAFVAGFMHAVAAGATGLIVQNGEAPVQRDRGGRFVAHLIAALTRWIAVSEVMPVGKLVQQGTHGRVVMPHGPIQVFAPFETRPSNEGGRSNEKGWRLRPPVKRR